VGILQNRYGQTGPYGSGTYKGDLGDAPGRLPGLHNAATKKCFHLGIREEQGGGWAEVQDGDWVWPESQAAVANIFDNSGQMLLIVWDEDDGLPWIINTREGPSGSGMTTAWKDKIDTNVSGSGTEIPTKWKRLEDSGSERHLMIEYSEGWLHLRPVDAANRGASGYGTTGLRSGMQIDVSLYADGVEASAQSSASDVSVDREILFPKKVRAEEGLQLYAQTDMSEFRVTSVELKYIVKDKPRIPYKGNQTEGGYQLLFAAPSHRITRGANLFLDVATGDTLAGAGTATTGPDGKTNSAITITTTVEFDNDAVAAGTFLIWHKTGYTVAGITLTQVSTSGTWILSKATGALPASIELVAGDVFDVCVYSTVLTAAAIADYSSNVINEEGKNYLPRW